MPSTYTLNNGIELIGTGEQSGTWGDTTNTNLELLDTALDGQVTITLASAGSSGSPNDLPISDGTASSGRNRMIIFNDGGDLGATAYVQLTPNDAEKIIYVRNDLSGSRSIILFQGTYNASNDYELPAGTTAVIFFDGAGSGAVAANVFNNAYFDSLRLGSVSVTEIIDDDTMATAAATNIATSESIKAYVDAQVGANNELSEVLANGNTSGGNAIQMTTTDELQFRDTALKISSSADGQLDIDADTEIEIVAPTVDIDASTAMTIDTAALTVTGAVDLNTSLNVDGTITSDGLTVDGDVRQSKANGTTLILEGSTASSGDLLGRIKAETTLALNGDNPASLKFLSTGTTSGYHGGAVEIHTTNNNITGELKRFRIANNGDITFYDNDGNASFVYDESAGVTVNDNQNAKDFTVKSDNNASMLYVDGANDRVGVGLSNPATEFHLHGVAGSAPELSISEGGARSVIKTTRNSDDNGDLRFLTEISGTIDTRMLISYQGNVGIQNTAPDGLLSLGSTSSTSAVLNFKTTKSTFSITPSNTDAGGTTLETSFVAGGHGPMIFRTAGAENMRLKDGVVFNNGSADQDFTIKTPSYSQAFFVDGGNNTVNIRNGTSNANNSMNISGNIRLGAESATRGDVIRSAGGASSAYNGIVIMSNAIDSADQANTSLPSWLVDIGGSWADGTNFPPDTADHVTIARRAAGGSKYSSTKYVSIGSAGTIFNIDNADADFTVESVGSSHMLHVDAANSRVGINDNTPERAFSVVGGSDFFLAGNNTNGGTIRLGSNRTNNATQYGVINMQQYNNTNEPEGYLLIGGTAASGLNYINIGGGVDEQNMATNIRMFTGPDTNTRSSSVNGLRMSLDYQTVYFNGNGEAVDFRYDSDTVGKALFYDSSENTMEIGGASSGTVGGGRLKVVSPSIGANVNDRLRLQQWYYGTGNGSFFTLKARREAANGVWTGVVTDFVLEVDNSADIYTYQTFGIGSVRFNDFQSSDVDFIVKTDTMNKLFINAGEDEMQIVLGTTTGKGVQFTDGSNERLEISYDGGQKVSLTAQSAPGGSDVDTFSIKSYANGDFEDIIAVSRNGAILEQASSPNGHVAGRRQNKRYFYAGTNFNNPTLTLATITASATYPQAVFKVTVWNHGTSANATGYSVGYVTLECDSPYTTWQKSEQAFAFEFNTYASALPTWNITTASPSANQATIAITCNRFTNFDFFMVEVELLIGGGMSIAWAA